MEEFVGIIYRIIGSCGNVYIGSSQNYTPKLKTYIKDYKLKIKLGQKKRDLVKAIMIINNVD